MESGVPGAGAAQDCSIDCSGQVSGNLGRLKEGGGGGGEGARATDNISGRQWGESGQGDGEVQQPLTGRILPTESTLREITRMGKEINKRQQAFGASFLLRLFHLHPVGCCAMSHRLCDI